MRGEDVAELQNRLGSLGFDAGRVDGIFGPATLRALKDFQHNVALPEDGICGPTTVEELLRVFGRSPTNVHSVKELEDVRSALHALTELEIAVVHEGFMDAPAQLLRSALAIKGAQAQVTMHPDPSTLAQMANMQNAHLCIHLESRGQVSEIRYYQGFSYTSATGRALATLISRHMNHPACNLRVEANGLNVPVLRETRMTAVSVSMQSAEFWVLNSHRAAVAISDAISEWTSSDFRHTL